MMCSHEERLLSPSTTYVYHSALQAVAAGISVVPIRADGSKQPALSSWRVYQQRRATFSEIAHWFGGAREQHGIALVTGAISGNLEALDFDCPQTFASWLEHVRQDVVLAALWEQLSAGYLEATPTGGCHVLYRCEQIDGNRRLACRREGDTHTTLIETRGEGGLLITAPSRGSVHPSGKPYLLLQGGIPSIRTIGIEQRNLLLDALRAFDQPRASHLVLLQSPDPARSVTPYAGTLRPGDRFNRYARWEDVLLPHGWQLVRLREETGYWRRPGKEGPGISATSNYQGHDLLYVFSTSTIFEPERGYTKFSAYTLLNHGGDYAAAARALLEQEAHLGQHA